MAGQSIWCTNYDWDRDITQERRAEKKRWNGKVITTGRQWANNADGALAVASYSEAKLWDAVRDYYDSRQKKKKIKKLLTNKELCAIIKIQKQRR